MKEIPLTRGKVALVDDEDYEWLSQWKWCVMRRRRIHLPDVFYAVRGSGKRILMHRVIADARSDVVVDHRDYDGLNNQRFNLRVATQGQNVMASRRPVRDLPRGVSFDKSRQKFAAKIEADNKCHFLGRFSTPEEAGQAYQQASLRLHGEFSIFNQAKGV